MALVDAAVGDVVLVHAGEAIAALGPPWGARREGPAVTVPPPVRVRVHVEGIVQGVGFRPFVHGLARELGLAGSVGNDAAGVVVEVEGGEAAVAGLRRRPPRAAARPGRGRVRPVGGSSADRVPAGSSSPAARSPARGRALVSADTATCGDCLAEMRDPADRRYRYPFVNCTNCGPRYTIVRDVPYDRATTTMAGFTMCAPCAAEYHDPADRRFHAQPTCCPDCGPTLVLEPGGPGDPVREAAARLRDGAVLAVKGLGGYHLAVRADDVDAVARLRAAKHREEKPFAVMAGSLDDARALVEVGPGAAEALGSRRAPDRPAAAQARCGGGAGRRAGQPRPRGDAALHPAAPPARRRARRAVRADQRERLGRADRPRRRRRPHTPGGPRRRVPHPRPADPRPHRRLGGAPAPRRASCPSAAPVGTPPNPWGSPSTSGVRCWGAAPRSRTRSASRPVGGRSCPRTSGTSRTRPRCARSTRRPGTWAACSASPRSCSRTTCTPTTSPPGTRSTAPTPSPTSRRSACSTTTPTWPPASPSTGRRPTTRRCSASPTTAPGSARTAPSGAASCCSPVSRGYRRVGHLATVPMPGGAAAVREPWRMAAAYAR